MRSLYTILALALVSSSSAFANNADPIPVKSCTELVNFNFTNMNAGLKRDLISKCRSEGWKLETGSLRKKKIPAQAERVQTAELQTETADAGR